MPSIFLQGRSTLTADPRGLVESAGSGTPIGNVARGEPGFKERIDFGEMIGQFSDRGTGDLVPTSVGILHYGLRAAPGRGRLVGVL
ncbi:polymorphic toxin type 50 domain-containing protein [Cellulomonas soli]|uniref:polymorphic toxin type 50 domain-containing protein n=1 Tax=Cellulomonas soli TaxID=931535 RepID=UPI001DBA6358|nr:hypothetical protein [Cellulomonadaceae bacterium]